jgi:outer membrane protein OmpA-like peptidoglycan-associated protein
MAYGILSRVRHLWVALLIAIAVASTSAVRVQAQEGQRPGAWEISPFAAGWDDFPEFGPGGLEWFVDPDHGVLRGTQFGYHWATGLFLESEIGFVPMKLHLTDRTGGGLDLLLSGAGLGYEIPLSSAAQVFGSVGAGAARWRHESEASQTDLTLNLGAGARWFLSDNFGLRVDAKLRYTPNALEGVTAALGESFPGESLTAWSLGGGVVFRFGGAKDSEDRRAHGPVVVENVLFDVNSSRLGSGPRAILDRAGRVLQDRPKVSIHLSGHTDSTASEVYNERLGERRARAVMDYLMSRFAIPEGRFVLLSFGETHPVADNATEAGRRLNRRVVVRVRD